MKSSRRKFLTSAASAAGAVLLLREAGFGQDAEYGFDAKRSGGDALAGLAWKDFCTYQNTDFSFSKLGVSPQKLTLVGMNDLRPVNRQIPESGQECFSLNFASSSRLGLTQDIYDVSHFRLGAFRLFITAGEQVSRQQTYVAVINRVTS